ncbi:hypothetical protein SAMN04488126_10583 [Bhargavaea beijingensis]|uniref:Uncharacterized protein n=1 Tax=Bhargavaea beijingensis TaxID=426756 RepID=A0A1G7B6I9_9BACL|nr:hypothetical protein [Bhargavaea beijingensis]SDE22744.1 hypothetical protein SAMN04488126_10583 [Bhargavaea beijingensis]
MITEIRFETTESGPLRPNEERVHDVRITRDGQIVHEILLTNEEAGRGMRHTRDEYQIAPGTAAAFLDSLTADFGIGEWPMDFGSPVLEGRTYEIAIRHDDGTVRRSRGTVDLPPDGEALRNAVIGLAAFKRKPWIF